MKQERAKKVHARLNSVHHEQRWILLKQTVWRYAGGGEVEPANGTHEAEFIVRIDAKIRKTIE